jgi:hypothetical protein
MRAWSPVPKQPNGTPGKKPPAPSIEVRLARSFSTMGENSQSAENSTDAECGRRSKSVPATARTGIDARRCLRGNFLRRFAVGC